jgi:hypothetical protein
LEFNTIGGFVGNVEKFQSFSNTRGRVEIAFWETFGSTVVLHEAHTSLIQLGHARSWDQTYWKRSFKKTSESLGCGEQHKKDRCSSERESESRHDVGLVNEQRKDKK